MSPTKAAATASSFLILVGCDASTAAMGRVVGQDVSTRVLSPRLTEVDDLALGPANVRIRRRWRGVSNMPDSGVG